MRSENCMDVDRHGKLQVRHQYTLILLIYVTDRDP